MSNINNSSDFQLNLQNPNDVFTFFKSLSTETDKAKRNLLEAQLMQLETNLTPLIHVCHEAIKENISNQTSTLSIFIFIKNTLSKINKSDKEYFINIIHAFLPIFKMIGYLNKNISETITETLGVLLKFKFIQSNFEIQSELFDFMIRDIDMNSSLEIASSVYHVVFTLLNTNISDKCFIGLLERGKKTLDFLMHFVSAHLKNITSLDNEEKIKYFTKIIVLKKNFFELLFLISMKLKKQGNLEGETKENLISSYLDYAYETIIYESQNTSFMSFTGNKEIDCSVNGLKAKAFMWISLLIQYDGADEITHPKLIEKGVSLFGLIKDGFKFIIKNCMEYLQNMQSEEGNNTDYEYNTIIFQANLFLSRVLIRRPFIDTMIGRIKE